MKKTGVFNCLGCLCGLVTAVTFNNASDNWLPDYQANRLIH